MSNDNKPVHRIRLSAISAAIFKNESDQGHVRYNTQFDRSYKDGEGWKHTQSFGRDDLLLLGKVADLAHSWIFEQQQANRESAPSDPNPS